MSDVQHGPLFIKPLVLSFPPFYLYDGDIAQLARASALQAEGQGFESPYLHKPQPVTGKTAEDLDIR